MAILITGSSGYIGTELCRRLATSDAGEIVGIDLAPPRASFPRFQFLRMDSTGDLHEVFRRHDIETIIHLVYVLNMTHDSLKMLRVNVGSLENVLRHAGNSVKRIVVTSSATAYGAHPDNPEWLTEDAPLRGNRSYQYAFDKTLVEARLREFSRSRPEVQIVVARPAIVCGPHIGNFISRYVSKPWVLLPRVCAEMQFLHEEDAAAALHVLATVAPAGVYNVGPPSTIAPSEVTNLLEGRVLSVPAGLLKSLTAAAWFLRLSSLTEAPASMIDFMRYRWVVDGSKLERLTSFRYRFSSEDAIRAFAARRA